MNKIALATLTVLSAVSAQAFAVETTADVVRVEPMYQRMEVPHQRCHTEQVTQQVQTNQGRSNGNVAGSVLGGLAGALIGAQIGDGSGKKAAIAAGAIGGTMLGSDMTKDSNSGGYTTQTVPVERCSTVIETQESVSGYRVTYRYAGIEYTTTMQEKPGRRIPVDVQVTPRQYGRGY